MLSVSAPAVNSVDNTTRDLQAFWALKRHLKTNISRLAFAIPPIEFLKCAPILYILWRYVNCVLTYLLKFNKTFNTIRLYRALQFMTKSDTVDKSIIFLHVECLEFTNARKIVLMSRRCTLS